jgi:hemerythrin-like domain-containing protein
MEDDMGQKKGNLPHQELDQHVDIIDLILADHKFIKECIEVLLSEETSKKEKLSISRDFLETLHAHLLAEKKTVYKSLVDNEQLHFIILEADVEHQIVEKEIKSLSQKLSRVRTLKDEVEAELKVLAELVQKHIQEEESEMLPTMKAELTEEVLHEIGQSFLKARKFNQGEAEEFPLLQDELIQWKDSVQEISSKFLSKMDKYVENLKH